MDLQGFSDNVKFSQGSMNLNDIQSTKTIELNIGQSLYRIQSQYMIPSQQVARFLQFVSTCSQNQFNYRFYKEFPFFMYDFLRLYKRLQKNFSKLSIKKEQFLRKKYDFSVEYDILLKFLLRNTDKFTLFVIKTQSKKFKRELEDRQIKMIFRNMVESTAEDLRIELLEKDTLKTISHVKFNVLKTLYIGKNPIKSLEPLKWIDLPNLEVMQIGLLCSTSIKPMAYCWLPQLTQLNLSHIFEFHTNRISQPKKSVSLSPLSRTKLYPKLDKDNEFCRSAFILWDMRQLVKLEWKRFFFPYFGNQFPVNQRFATYFMNRRQMDALSNRAHERPKEQVEFGVWGFGQKMKNKDRKMREMQESEGFEEFMETQNFSQRQRDNNQKKQNHNLQNSFEVNTIQPQLFEMLLKQPQPFRRTRPPNYRRRPNFNDLQNNQMFNMNPMDLQLLEEDNLFIYDDTRLYWFQDREELLQVDAERRNMPQIQRIVNYGREVNFDQESEEEQGEKKVKIN